VQPLDILLSIPLFWSLWLGWRRGLVKELVNTLGLIVAIFSGFMLLDVVLLILKPIFGVTFWLPILTFILIVVAILFTARHLATYTHRAIKHTFFGDADALAGAVLSLIKMAFVISTLLWLIGVMKIKIPERHTYKTFIYPALLKIGPGFSKAIFFASSLLLASTS
jgi:membrane protein required for colicin V production